MSVALGVDFGSSRIKAAAYARDGRVVASSSVETPLVSGPVGDDFLVLAMLTAAATAVKSLGLAPGAIGAVGLTSMGEVGTVLADGVLLDLAFPSWYDDRGGEVVRAAEARFGATALRDLTCRHMRVASTVAKLGHLIASGTPVPSGVFLGICGAFAWQLTGETWQEAGLATTSGVFDPVSRAYALDVWDHAGMGSIDLPPVLEAGVGKPAVTSLARQLGIVHGAPVVIAGHDHPVATVGAGVGPGDVSDSMGTGEALIAVVRDDLAVDARHRREALDSDPFVSFEVWPASGELLVVWERMRPGLAMRTFVDRSGLNRATLDAGALPPAISTRCTEEVSRALEAGIAPPIDYDATMWGELIDFYVLLANRGQGFIRQISGASGETVLTGGGLRSRRWRESKIALGDTAMAVSTVQETATRGCAALAGTAAGWWPSPIAMPGAARVPVAHGARHEFDEAARALGW